jgi:selenide,water dikinase
VQPIGGSVAHTGRPGARRYNRAFPLRSLVLMNAPEPVRLTALSHGGGCGCKIAPAVLRELVARATPGVLPPQLMVGIESSDDAAVYRLNDTQAVVSTTDFFTPIVDDPFDFGAIAATNALSDVYAMGGTPLLALALVGMPLDRLPAATIRRILEGGESACARAGIPVAGGHSIDALEPIYGLAVTGLVDPRHVKRNDGACAGDVLVLGKPLGIGVYSAALRKGRLSETHYAVMVDSTTRLNTPGAKLGAMAGVHALTDVTGFGLLGHLLEMCRGAQWSAAIDVARVPLHPGVRELAGAGFVTGASGRNLAGYGAEVDRGRASDLDLALLADPQTSGGLLVACAPADADAVLALFAAEGFAQAAVIGEMRAGQPAQVTLR